MFSCASINVNGLRNNNKRSKILNWLNLQNFQVIFLQETHFTNNADVDRLEQEWRGSSFHSFGTSNSSGVSILFKSRISPDKVKVAHDSTGRLISLLLDTDDSTLQFCNIYAPNKVSDRVQFFENMSSYIKRGFPTVLGGDFNCIEDIFLDKFGGDNDTAPTSVSALQELLKLFNLIDAFRNLHPSAKCFTWFKSDNSISCRLDRFYISPEIFQGITVAEITPFSYSDHDCPFISFLEPNTSKRGSGYWKSNASLLENKNFVVKMSAFLHHWCLRRHDFTNLHAWWDICKRKIKYMCMKFSKRLSREKRARRKFLERHIRLC